MREFLRASYIVNNWHDAHRKVTTELSPINHGWKIMENKYEFDWFEGEQVPQLVNDVVLQPPQENSDSQSETTELGTSDRESQINEFDDSGEEFDYNE
ncbi:hypothetical protein JTB14_024164 [Gonioctena quinquepunctata]|nr:hypothetical protein JTB14_024164 [Gonioctena quinquepunctata]